MITYVLSSLYDKILGHIITELCVLYLIVIVESDDVMFKQLVFDVLIFLSKNK